MTDFCSVHCAASGDMHVSACGRQYRGIIVGLALGMMCFVWAWARIRYIRLDLSTSQVMPNYAGRQFAQSVLTLPISVLVARNFGILTNRVLSAILGLFTTNSPTAMVSKRRAAILCHLDPVHLHWCYVSADCVRVFLVKRTLRDPT